MPLPGSPANAVPADEAWLNRRIEQIERDARERYAALMMTVGPAIADLQAQQATLTAQNATLTDAVNDITALVNAQVTFGVATTVTTTGWTVSTGMVTKASTTITVPSGFTQASVTASGAMHFQDSAPNGGWIRVVIAGNAGGEMGGLANLNLGQSANHSVGLTSLTAGSTITIETQVRASAASGVTTGRIAQVSASALFFR